MKVFLATLGCRANQYDTEAVRGMLVAGGCEIASTPGDADAAIFNSCAVTADAEADLRQMVRRAARANPRLNTVVMGCAAALDRGMIRSLPTVSRVIPGADLAQVADALGAGIAPDTVRPARQTGARALLKIQEGCDEHCTFCATRLARGASRSRPLMELLEEAHALALNHSEIVLTGIHIGSYGADIGSALSLLVERLMRDVGGVRFRLTSVEATEVDDRLRALLTAGDGRLTPHLHAPLQSGSDRILKRMGRHWYSTASYAAAVESIARQSPVFAFGADMIAGFPGENDDDHAATLSLVRSLPFTYLHVFPYSPRTGTEAAKFGAPVTSTVASRRAEELRLLGTELQTRYRQFRAGGSADVVVTGNATRREGLTEDYLTVVTADSSLARGSRFQAMLEENGGTLLARPASR